MSSLLSLVGKALVKGGLVNKYISILGQPYRIRTIFGVGYVGKSVAGTRVTDNISRFYHGSVLQLYIFAGFKIFILPVFTDALLLCFFGINLARAIFLLQAVAYAEFGMIERACFYIIFISINNALFFKILAQFYVVDLIL